MPAEWLFIGDERRVAVSNDHRFGTDAVLLAYFAQPQAGEQVCDLGTGCGILPFLWLRDGVSADLVGVELQADAVALAQQSVADWGNPKDVTFIQADLREWAPTQRDRFDRVTCNPPYFPAGSGRVAASPAARLARHEGEGCTFDEVCTAAALLLRPSGRLCFCHRPSQLPRLYAVLAVHGFSLTQQILVRQRAETAPFLLLAEAQRANIAGQPRELTWVLEENGTPSHLTRRIYAPFYKEVAP